MNAIETTEKAYSALSEQSQIALATLDKISSSNFSVSELPRLKIPLTGETAFTIETSGTKKKVQYMEGVVVAQNNIRTLWNENELHLPICFSNDSIFGIGMPGGNCSSCSLAQSSPNDNDSKCRQRKIVLILRREDILPIALVARSKLAKALSEYFLQLASNRVRPCFAVSSFSIKQEKDRMGITFPKINVQIERLLSEKEKQIAAVYANKFSRILNAQTCIY